MNSQVSLYAGLLMIALFSIAIISFTVNFGIDNSASINLFDDPEMSTMNTMIKANLSGLKTDSEKTYTSIADTTVEPGSDVVTSAGSFKITWLNAFNIGETIFTVAYRKIFGSEGSFGIFLTSFLAFLLFTAGVYLIRTWRGNP